MKRGADQQSRKRGRSPGGSIWRALAGGVAAVVVALAAGCATGDEHAPIDYVDADFVRQHVGLEVNPDTGEHWAIGPPYFPRGRFGPQMALWARWTGDIRGAVYDVYYYHPLDAWAFYEAAVEAGNQALRVDLLGRKIVSTDVLEERVAVRVPFAALDEARAEGKAYRFVLLGKNRREEIAVPDFYLRGFFRKMELWRQQAEAETETVQQVEEKLAPVTPAP